MENVRTLQVNPKRGRYEETVARYPNGSVSESLLEASVALLDGNNSYEFDFMAPQGGGTRQFHKLGLKETFEAYEIGMFIGFRDTIKPGKEVLLPYNDLAFAVAKGGYTLTQAEDLDLIWNSDLQIQVNQQVYFDSLSTDRFKFVPQQQYDAVGTEQLVYRPNLGPDAGYWDLQPKITFFGSKTNKVTLLLNTFSGANLAAKTSGIETRVYLRVRGFKIQFKN